MIPFFGTHYIIAVISLHFFQNAMSKALDILSNQLVYYTKITSTWYSSSLFQPSFFHPYLVILSPSLSPPPPSPSSLIRSHHPSQRTTPSLPGSQSLWSDSSHMWTIPGSSLPPCETSDSYCPAEPILYPAYLHSLDISPDCIFEVKLALQIVSGAWKDGWTHLAE